MPLPDAGREPLQPGPPVLPGRRADRAGHPRRPSRAGRPDRERGRPRRPARTVPSRPLRQAIQTLVDKGLLVRKRGVGTQVVNAPIRRTVELTSLYDDLTRSGLRPTTTVLGLDLVPADEAAAQKLNLPSGHKVWRLRPAPRGQGRAARADVQPRPRGASPTSRWSTSTTPASTSTSGPRRSTCAWRTR